MGELPHYHKHFTFDQLHDLCMGLGESLYKNIREQFHQLSDHEIRDLLSNVCCVTLLCIMVEHFPEKEYDNFSCDIYDMLQSNINRIKND